MSITFTCPHCQQSGRAPDRLAGHHATCPSCKNAFAVPAALTPPPFNGPPAVYDAYPPPVAEDDNSQSDWQRTAAAVRLVLWLLCVGWCVAALGLFAMSWGQANGAIQQAALGVQSCMWLMSGFFAVYALDRALLGRR